MELIKAEANLNVVADLSCGGRSNSSGDGLTCDGNIEINLCAHEFGNVYLSVEEHLCLCDLLGLVVSMLRTDTEDNFLAYIGIELTRGALLGGNGNLILIEVEGVLAATNILQGRS